MKKMVVCLSVCCSLLAAAVSLGAETQITVDVGKPGAKISPTMWGIFFEDINFGADGGLYAELVKNRSFEFPDALMGWRTPSPAGADPSALIQTERPFNPANPHYLRLRSAGESPCGVSNEGFRGIGVHADEAYRFTTQARQSDDGKVRLRIELVDGSGTVLASARLGVSSDAGRDSAVPSSAKHYTDSFTTPVRDGVNVRLTPWPWRVD